MMSAELVKRIVELESQKKIRGGMTRKLAVSVIHELETLAGNTPTDPKELVRLRHLSSSCGLKPLSHKKN